jgi:hypothetical protein
VKLSTYFDQEKIRQLVTWFGVEPALNSAPADAVFAKLIELKLLDSPPGDITHLYEFLVESKHLVMVKLCNEYLEHQRRAKAQQQPQPQPTKLQLQSDLLNAGSMKIPVRAAVAKHPVTHAQEVTDKKRGVRILCIDGAGARGVVRQLSLSCARVCLFDDTYTYSLLPLFFLDNVSVPKDARRAPRLRSTADRLSLRNCEPLLTFPLLRTLAL